MTEAVNGDETTVQMGRRKHENFLADDRTKFDGGATVQMPMMSVGMPTMMGGFQGPTYASEMSGATPPSFMMSMLVLEPSDTLSISGTDAERNSTELRQCSVARNSRFWLKQRIFSSTFER